MNSIIDFIVSWKDLITKVFGEHTLAAAIVTIVAVAAFYVLDHQVRKGKRPTNLMIVFVGWAILVPIVGLVMTILAKIWAILEAVFPRIADALASFYKIYDQHPLLVLIIIVVGFASYFLWRKFRPSILPSRPLRILALVGSVVLVAHIVSPIANWVTPAPGPEVKKDVGPKLIESAASIPSPLPPSQRASSMPSPSAPSVSQPIAPSVNASTPSPPASIAASSAHSASK